MAHEITGEQFFDASGMDAWHRLSIFKKLGIVKEDRAYTAKEVYALFGRPEYSMAPKYVVLPDGTHVALDEQSIIRHPVDDDPQFKVVGNVKDHYELVGGRIAVDLWDKHIDLPVETMMMLRNDGVLVITATMPDYDIKNEKVKNYLIWQNGMNGRTASRSDVSAQRVVCANTLRAAQRRTVHHTQGSADRLIEFMVGLVDRANFQREVMKETFEILAETPFDPDNIKWIGETIYPDYPKPDPDFAYKKGYDWNLNYWERAMERIEHRRKHLEVLFTENKAIGFDDPDCQTAGTAWHMYNVISERASHYDGSNGDSLAESLIIGDRAATIEKGLDLILTQVPEAQKSMYREYAPVAAQG